MNIEKLTKKDLIKVIASMHDTIQTWDQGYGLSESDAKIIIEVGSAATLLCIEQNDFELSTINDNVEDLNLTKGRVTVGQMVRSLERFPYGTAIEISVRQYNKVNPVVYMEPERNDGPGSTGEFVADMRNGHTVRINVSLPSDGDKFMYVSESKKK